MDRALLYSIETMVIQWTQQMGSVLQRDSTHVLRQGGHPGPSAELQFWAAQRENLLGIQKQVCVCVGVGVCVCARICVCGLRCVGYGVCFTVCALRCVRYGVCVTVCALRCVCACITVLEVSSDWPDE